MYTHFYKNTNKLNIGSKTSIFTFAIITYRLLCMFHVKLLLAGKEILFKTHFNQVNCNPNGQFAAGNRHRA